MKKIILVALFSTALLSFGQSVQAEETLVEDKPVEETPEKELPEKELQGKTKGTIQFKQNDGDLDYDKEVTDPGNGGENIGDGEDIIPPEGGDATTGPLRFNYVPAIRFGDNRLSMKTQNYYALFDTITKKSDNSQEEKPTFFEVVDLRGGTKGWTVTVKNNRVFTSGDKSFKGTLAFTDMTVQTNSNISEAAQFPVLPSRDVETVVGTDAGSAVTLATATSAQQQGYGSWSVRIGDTLKKTTGQGKDGTGSEGQVDETKKDRNIAVKLTVDGGQIIDVDKTYSTDLVWDLVSAL